MTGNANAQAPAAPAPEATPPPAQSLQTIHATGFSLTPTSFQELVTFAKMVARSTMVPKDYIGKPENIIIAIQMGQDVGLKPLQALQNIAVIGGRPTVWGDAALAIVQGSGQLEYIKEDYANDTATCSIKRKGFPEVVRTFSMVDAAKAGLSKKDGPWTNYPKRMCQMRARGFALRDSFSDFLKGLSIREEMEDVVATAVQVEDYTPQRASEVKDTSADFIPEDDDAEEKYEEESESEKTDPPPEKRKISAENVKRVLAFAVENQVPKHTLNNYLGSFLGVKELEDLDDSETERVLQWLKTLKPGK